LNHTNSNLILKTTSTEQIVKHNHRCTENSPNSQSLRDTLWPTT